MPCAFIQTLLQKYFLLPVFIIIAAVPARATSVLVDNSIPTHPVSAGTTPLEMTLFRARQDYRSPAAANKTDVNASLEWNRPVVKNTPSPWPAATINSDLPKDRSFQVNSSILDNNLYRFADTTTTKQPIHGRNYSVMKDIYTNVAYVGLALAASVTMVLGVAVWGGLIEIGPFSAQNTSKLRATVTGFVTRWRTWRTDYLPRQSATIRPNSAAVSGITESRP
jgi:hypothetical protein